MRKDTSFFVTLGSGITTDEAEEEDEVDDKVADEEPPTSVTSVGSDGGRNI